MVGGGGGGGEGDGREEEGMTGYMAQECCSHMYLTTLSSNYIPLPGTHIGVSTQCQFVK